MAVTLTLGTSIASAWTASARIAEAGTSIAAEAGSSAAGSRSAAAAPAEAAAPASQAAASGSTSAAAAPAKAAAPSSQAAMAPSSQAAEVINMTNLMLDQGPNSPSVSHIIPMNGWAVKPSVQGRKEAAADLSSPVGRPRYLCMFKEPVPRRFYVQLDKDDMHMLVIPSSF